MCDRRFVSREARKLLEDARGAKDVVVMTTFLLRSCLPSSASLEAGSHGHHTVHVARVITHLADFPYDELSVASWIITGYLKRGFGDTCI